MKAILVNEAGGSDKLTFSDSHPVPKLQDGQVLIKNNYAGVNYVSPSSKRCEAGLLTAALPLSITLTSPSEA